jgi:hypothetical protein
MASRTISSDHHSPIVSSERATGQIASPIDLCRIFGHRVVASLDWLHYETRLSNIQISTKEPENGFIEFIHHTVNLKKEF